MKFIIDSDFDEYEELIPPNSSHDDLEVVINNSFKGDLLFCIVENVIIGNLHGIGTTHIYTKKQSEKNLSKIIYEYWEVVNKMKNDMKSVASFFDWYQRTNSYVVIGKNESNASNHSGHYKWHNKSIDPKKPGFHQYVKIKDKNLTDEYIREYLSSYVELLCSKKWFSKLPNYVIIVKPVSVFDENTEKYIPLGNLYLHFGTTNKKSVSFYRNLVNKILLVWLKNNGAKIVRKIETDPNTGYEVNESNKHIPNLVKKKHSRKLDNPKAVNSNARFTIRDLYIQLFDEPVNIDHRFDDLIHESSEVFSSMIDLLTIIRGMPKQQFKESKELRTIIELIRSSIEGITDISLNSYSTIDANCLSAFVKILSKRRVAIAFITIGGLPLDYVHKILLAKENSGPTEDKSMGLYLWNNFFIPYPMAISNKEMNSGLNSIEYKAALDVYRSCSIAEKEMIGEMYEHIVAEYPSYKTHKSNFLQNVI